MASDFTNFLYKASCYFHVEIYIKLIFQYYAVSFRFTHLLFHISIWEERCFEIAVGITGFLSFHLEWFGEGQTKVDQIQGCLFSSTINKNGKKRRDSGSSNKVVLIVLGPSTYVHI